MLEVLSFDSNVMIDEKVTPSQINPGLTVAGAQASMPSREQVDALMA